MHKLMHLNTRFIRKKNAKTFNETFLSKIPIPTPNNMLASRPTNNAVDKKLNCHYCGYEGQIQLVYRKKRDKS